MKRIFNAFLYSLSGLSLAIRDEAAFRQLLMISVAAMVAVIFLPISAAAKVIIVFAHLVSLAVELLNTGIESAIDRISEERHPLSKKAKDCGSAAQLVMMVGLLLVWVSALTHII
ncbi:MAG: diacylglycerol kinase [Burkholderiales bacterium]|jgi:diacylglycerol kinase (ATP)|nr:diacylglycerol kinase [Burkholderiales bacterium]